jgi:transposase InsO family protein/transposase-like protein
MSEEEQKETSEQSPPGEPGIPGSPGGHRGHSAAEKLDLIQTWERSGQPQRAWCAEHGISTASLSKWRYRLRKHGVAGLAPQDNPRNRKGVPSKVYTSVQRRQAVEAQAKSGLSLVEFGRVWGVGARALGRWRRAYAASGTLGLERKAYPKGSRAGTPATTQESILAAQERFPTFGLRKVRDWLLRFRGVKTSVPTVRKVLEAAGTRRPKEKAKQRRGPAQIRFFERARPNQLWQSDITQLWLAKQARHLYLTVFLDDHSRFVVSWSLATHHKKEMVIECLLDGIARFGKPEEVLTDQGRQYFAWRGKSDFEKQLERDGIKHVVSRSHHPETLGKTERLWGTVKSEFWERVRPQDLGEARERLGHFFHHYNFFRPHQGIGGVTPADRFFGAESAVRKGIEAGLQNELGAAVGEEKRTSVYLFGRVGDQEVSLHGERGRLVMRTSEGEREISTEALGAAQEARNDKASESGSDKGAARRAGTVGADCAGGAGAGPSESDGAPGILERKEDEGGSSGGAAASAGARLAAHESGIERYGGGLGETAAPRARENDAECRTEGDHPTTQGERGPGATAAGAGAADRGAARSAGDGDRGGEKEGAERVEVERERSCAEWDCEEESGRGWRGACE